MNENSRKNVDVSGILFLAGTIIVSMIFPGIWILGLPFLIGFGVYFLFGFTELVLEFKNNPLTAIFSFLFAIYLGSGFLGWALLFFGFN